MAGPVASAWPRRRRDRVIRAQGVTIVHRDPHPLNLLYPLDSASRSVKLIDWQSWRVDTGTDDLDYLMAFHYPRLPKAAGTATRSAEGGEPLGNLCLWDESNLMER